jgi:hypothetical protein
MEEIRIGQRVKWHNPNITNYDISDRKEIPNRIFEVFNIIDDNKIFICDEYGDVIVNRNELEIIDNDIEDKAMTFFYHALTNLRYNALKKIERLKYIEWNVLNPTILIKDENDNIIQQKISSIKYDDENLILFFENDTKEYLFNELTFCGHSSIELYRAILFYDLINN